MDIVVKNISDLLSDPANVRLHPEKNLHAIKGSLTRFGQQKPIVIDKKNIVIAGNGTLEAAQQLGWDTIECVVTSLDNIDKTAFAIADNRTAELAEWDHAALESELKKLKDLDVDISEFGFDDINLESEDESTDDSEMTYSQKIEAPIYEITGDEPEVSDLIDSEKTKKLINEIRETDLPKEIKDFLMLSAQRHNVFNFQKIAEFYAHQKPEVQNLMEKSALVIIDYNKAIENGYVRMSKNMAEAFDDNQGSH